MVTRLRQIELQFLRHRVLQEPDVIASLDLSKDQQARVETVAEEFHKKYSEVVDQRLEAQAELKSRREKLAASNDTYVADVKKLLTEKQRDTLALLVGARQGFTPQYLSKPHVIS